MPFQLLKPKTHLCPSYTRAASAAARGRAHHRPASYARCRQDVQALVAEPPAPTPAKT
jgi:hypothetical protein